MKKLILTLLCMAGASSASAYELVYDKAASTAAAAGVRCSTGTAIQINATEAVVVTNGNNLMAYRLQNQDGADSVWIGYNSSVSTDTAAGAALTNLGEELAFGINGVYPVGYDIERKAYTPIWCMAADAAGAAGVVLSKANFGYK